MRSLRFLSGALGFSAILPLAAAFLITAGSTPEPRQSAFRAVQAGDDAELDVGTILVADRELRDPNFAQTVILLAKYDDEGTLGVVLNRQTEAPISRVLSEWKEAKGRKDPVFAGGPVERSAILGLVRAKTAPEDAESILADVHLIARREALQKSLESETESSRFRVYLGYAGWAPEQLEHELELGAWHVLPGNASVVFDADPDSLWTRLIHKTETQIVFWRGSNWHGSNWM